MTTTTEELGRELSIAFERRSRRMGNASLFVKIILIAVGSFVSGFSQFFTAPPLGVPHVVGMAGAISAFVGAIFLAWTDQGTAREMEIARAALSKADQVQEDLRWIEVLNQEVRRAVELYASMSLMRAVVERALSNNNDLFANISNCVHLARRSLLLAFGFQLQEHWTICVYYAEKDTSTGEVVLRCVANERSIACEIDAVRKWPTGVGVAGIAFARSTTTIVPDIAAPQLGTLFNPGPLQKEYDLERYRSIAAVPISVGRSPTPWGVVVATSDRPDHFRRDDNKGGGASTVEAVRAVAGMVALIIAIDDALKKASSPHNSTALPTESGT